MSSYGSGNSIYHYCKLSTALEYILPTRELRLGPIIDTNDPRENKSYVMTFSHTTWGDVESQGDNSQISQILREDCKVLCFSQDHRAYGDESQELKFYGHELSRMWAYYGDNHKGLCLELDKEEFLKENEKLINLKQFKEVKYHEFDFKWPDHINIDHKVAESMGIRKYIKEMIRPEYLEFLFFY